VSKPYHICTTYCSRFGYCHCGCDTVIPTGRLYVKGHNLRIRVLAPRREARDMYSFLKVKYQTWPRIAEVTGIPLSTIEKHNRYPFDGGISLDNYNKLRRVVELYKRK
jgi:hypothetical protein